MMILIEVVEAVMTMIGEDGRAYDHYEDEEYDDYDNNYKNGDYY